ncbi:MAG: translation elongation factor Ts [Acidobacteriota bacterium]|jgi:elongation factor Ts|nr:translation elongation factor Ts [Acidobacteriota bacterium]
MAVDMELVKKLRAETGVGILECRKAVTEAGNNYQKAEEILRKRGFEKAKAKSSRATTQGVIGAYIHTNSKIGVLVEVGCETDFVAKNVDFQTMVKDIAMQIAALSPQYVAPEDVPAEVLEKEKEIYREQMKKQGKPENVVEKIIEGKLNKFYAEVCLLDQRFFKDDSKSIRDLVTEHIHKIGENIIVKRFVRYQVGG